MVKSQISIDVVGAIVVLDVSPRLFSWHYPISCTPLYQGLLPGLVTKRAAGGASDREAEVKTLHARIGQLTVENGFLSKAFGR